MSQANDTSMDARDCRCTVRRAVSTESGDALALLLEAAAWAAARGIDLWRRAELREDDFAAAARARELILGYADTEPVATMLLQSSDSVYWPDAAPGSALYIHKVAIRRAYAGQGWLSRLIAFAVDDARERGIARLRLDTILHPKLQSMYERHGFSVLAEEPLLVAGRRMIRMERTV